MGIFSALKNHILTTLNAISQTQSKVNRIDIFLVITGHQFVK